MRTRIEGYTKNSICITTDGEPDTINCEDAVVKLWCSSGTILGMKYGNVLYPNIWKIRVLYGPVDKNYAFKQVEYAENGFGSDIFETDEEIVNVKIIPRTYYVGDDI